MTINEACDRLRDHLQSWYEARKGAGEIKPSELGEAKRKFMEANPDCAGFDRDIYFDFAVVKGSSQSWCCCCTGSPGEHVRATGIVVEPIDWEATRMLALSGLE